VYQLVLHLAELQLRLCQLQWCLRWLLLHHPYQLLLLLLLHVYQQLLHPAELLLLLLRLCQLQWCLL
jgi:hypothetical protein